MRQGSIRRQALALFGGAFVGAIIGMAAISMAGDRLPVVGGGIGPLVTLLLTVLVYMLCIGVHEAGHLIAGALVGYRPLLLIAGPLRVERADGRARVGLNRSIALAGGLAVCVPVGLYDLRRRTLVMAAGGPIASLLLGVQALALWLATAPFLARGGVLASLANLGLIALGIGSLAIGLVTLLPMRTGGFYSDGARILRLIRASEEAEREVALIALTGLTMGGARPREWDAALVRRSTEIRDGGAFEVGGLLFAHAYGLDTGDVDSARTYLEAALLRVDQLPPATRASVHLAAAVFFALYDRNAQRARAALERAAPRGDLLHTPHQRLLALAAVHLAEGDTVGAAAAAHEARRLSARAVDRGTALLDAAHAELIISAAASAQRSPE
ncbi:MAG TPA: hypothetical protein VFZ24_03335 [Longimicrobiales bacterium]